MLVWGMLVVRFNFIKLALLFYCFEVPACMLD